MRKPNTRTKEDKGRRHCLAQPTTMVAMMMMMCSLAFRLIPKFSQLFFAPSVTVPYLEKIVVRRPRGDSVVVPEEREYVNRFVKTAMKKRKRKGAVQAGTQTKEEERKQRKGRKRRRRRKRKKVRLMEKKQPKMKS